MGAPMPVQRPSAEDLARIAERFSFTLDADQQATYGALLEAGVLPGYDALAEMEAPPAEVRWPRGPGRRPDDAENPYGAWYVKERIQGAPDGPLAGRTLAIKDNVA